MPATARRTTRRLLAAVAIGAATLALAACYYPGGAMESGKPVTYESTSFLPLTITIQNTRTKENIWTTDVPVGQQLVIDFNEGTRQNDALLPDTMDWEIMTAGTRYGALDNTVPMPPATERAIIVTKRKAPEAPVPVSPDRGRPSGGDM
jgi:hypothetical protein